MKTLRRLALPLAAILSATAPAAAQEADTEPMEQAMDQTMAQLGEMFPVVPLTADEQARLAVARGVVERIMPPGTMGELMGSMFDNMLGPMTKLAGDNPNAAFLSKTGIDAAAQGMTETQTSEALALLDHVWKERIEREAKIMPRMMTRLMTDLEPAMRTAMSELYAVYFDERELADIDAFFSTESGATYARESFRMSSDPRLMGAMMEQMPVMMTALMGMAGEMEQATADLPPVRHFKDLDAGQRTRLSELTGLPSQELEIILSETELHE